MNKFIPYIFHKHEILKDFDNEKQLNNWLASKIKSNSIKKVRNGLYVAIDSAGYVFSSKFEIASKISKDSFVAYHSALEFHGVANQVFSDVIVSSSTRFNNFEFEDIEYINKVTKNYIEVMNIVTSGVRVSSLERTIIDCIDNINLAGGIEEILNALDQTKFLDEKKLLCVLKSYNQILLYQKVGFILEQFKEQLSLSDEFFKACQCKLTNQIKYFLQDEYKEIEYNAIWKLMAPKNLKSRINGGY